MAAVAQITCVSAAFLFQALKGAIPGASGATRCVCNGATPNRSGTTFNHPPTQCDALQ